MTTGIEDQKYWQLQGLDGIPLMKSYLDALSSKDAVDHQEALRSAKADGGLEALLNLFSISQNGTFEGPIPWNDELAQNIVPRYSLSQSNLTLDGQHKFKDTSWLTYFKNLTTIDITGDFSDVTIDLNEVNKNSERFHKRPNTSFLSFFPTATSAAQDRRCKHYED